MDTLIVTIHIIACVALVILVLLQPGKEGMGVIFGGSNSSMFGSKGAGGALTKLTIFVSIVFLGTSLLFTYKSVKKEKSVADTIATQATTTQKSQPLLPVQVPVHNQVVVPHNNTTK